MKIILRTEHLLIEPTTNISEKGPLDTLQAVWKTTKIIQIVYNSEAVILFGFSK